MTFTDKDRKILIGEYGMLNASTPPEFFGDSGTDGKNIVKNFIKRYKVENIQWLMNEKKVKDPMCLEFDMIGVDPAFANAVRRILISDVPSMAIEKVFIYNNTSIVQDEILSHRLGLIPLKADPRLFQMKEIPDDPVEDSSRKSEEELVEEAEGTEKDTIIYEVKIRCKRNPTANPKSREVKDFVDSNVHSKSIKPIRRQGQPEELGMIHDDILIAKMRPGHELDLKLYAVKGYGRDHAKFSPVATASYRLLPEVKLLKPVIGDAAQRLQSCFSEGVIGIKKSKGSQEAYVKNARYDACSRNIYRHEDLKESVEMSKVRDHFIFNIESVGAIPPEELVPMAMDVLVEKCDYFINVLEQVTQQ